MKNLPFFAVALLLFVPSTIYGQQQISPNPNSGNIYVTTPDWVNGEDFSNYYEDANNIGLVQINHGGVLTNHKTSSAGADITFANRANFKVISAGGTFVNQGFFLNRGTYGFIANQGAFDNKANGSINNAAGNLDGTSGISNISGTLTNQGDIFNGRDEHGLAYENAVFNNLVNAEIYNQSFINNQGQMANHGHIYNQTSGVISNWEKFDNKSAARVRNWGTFTNEKDAYLINNGVIDNLDGGNVVGQFVNHGHLSGTGIILGDVTDHGTMAAGNSAGLLKIDGDYFKVAGSKEVELGGLLNHDRIHVTGNVELAGQLNVELIDGFELHRGNFFEFLRVGGTLSGQYDGLGNGDLIGNFGGQDLFIGYNYSGEWTGVALFTNPVPEPTTVLIWSMLAGLGMTIRRRR